MDSSCGILMKIWYNLLVTIGSFNLIFMQSYKKTWINAFLILEPVITTNLAIASNTTSDTDNACSKETIDQRYEYCTTANSLADTHCGQNCGVESINGKDKTSETTSGDIVNCSECDIRTEAGFWYSVTGTTLESILQKYSGIANIKNAMKGCKNYFIGEFGSYSYDFTHSKIIYRDTTVEDTKLDELNITVID